MEARALLTGAGTVYGIARSGVSGLLTVTAKTADTPFAHLDGSFGGEDFIDVRPIGVDYILKGTPAQVTSRLATLETTWAPSGSTNEELHLQWPGIGHVYFEGRFNGLDVYDLRDLRFGVGRATGLFRALVPDRQTA